MSKTKKRVNLGDNIYAYYCEDNKKITYKFEKGDVIFVCGELSNVSLQGWYDLIDYINKGE